MPYSSFTVSQIKEDFGITIREDFCFVPKDIPLVAPSVKLLAVLEDLPWAIAVGTEKARSEVIINPVLLEVRRQLAKQVSVFSGEEMNVDAASGLNGVCDFVISRSPEQLVLEAPIIVLVEAKKADLKIGLPQCMAEMLAAQRFNQNKGKALDRIFGVVTSGTQWRLMQLEGQIIDVDLQDYGLDPLDRLLGMLVWMAATA